MVIMSGSRAVKGQINGSRLTSLQGLLLELSSCDSGAVSGDSSIPEKSESIEHLEVIDGGFVTSSLVGKAVESPVDECEGEDRDTNGFAPSSWTE